MGVQVMRVCFYVSLVQVITPFNLDNRDPLLLLYSDHQCCRMHMHEPHCASESSCA